MFISRLCSKKTNKSHSNHEHIPPKVHNTYSRLCKVLLKQQKISYEYRTHAVNILGSLAEQESYYIEYDMYNDLADFYVKQQRHEDHFHLLIKLCRLEEAFYVWFERKSSDCPVSIPESKIMNVLDYFCAGKRTSGLSKSKAATILKKPDTANVPKIASRFAQWITVCQISIQGLTSLYDEELKSVELRAFVSVQVSDSRFRQGFQNF